MGRLETLTRVLGGKTCATALIGRLLIDPRPSLRSSMSTVPSTSTSHSSFVSISTLRWKRTNERPRKTSRPTRSFPPFNPASRPRLSSPSFETKSPHTLTCVFLGIPFSKHNLCGIGVLLLVGVSHGSLAQPLLTSFPGGSSRDKLIELFNRIEHFFRRLEIYTGITPTTAMTDIIIEIMVEVLAILAIASYSRQRKSNLNVGQVWVPLISLARHHCTG